MNKAPSDRAGDYALAKQHGLPPAKVYQLQTLLSAQPVKSRDQQWAPDMAAFPRGISQLPDGRTIALEYLRRWKGHILTGTDTCSVHGFTIPISNISAKTTISVFFSFTIFHRALLLTKGLILQIMKCANRFVGWRSGRSSTSLKFVMARARYGFQTVFRRSSLSAQVYLLL